MTKPLKREFQLLGSKKGKVLNAFDISFTPEEITCQVQRNIMMLTLVKNKKRKRSEKKKQLKKQC